MKGEYIKMAVQINKCSSTTPIILVDRQGNKIEAYMDKSRMLIFTQYMTVHGVEYKGFKILEKEQ